MIAMGIGYLDLPGLLASHVSSSISVELWAVRDGLARCCGLSIAAVEIDIDVFVAISLLSHSTSTNGELSSLIEDCRNLMKNIPQV